MNGLWIGKTGEANAWYHISLIAHAEVCNNLCVVRYKKPVRKVESNNVDYHLFKDNGRLLGKIKMFLKGREVIKNEKKDFIITFNAFPYGMIAYLLALFYKLPLIICFIGYDFNYFFKKQPFRFLIIKALKKAHFIICKGNHMTEELLKVGIKKEKLKYYPHFVSDKWFVNDLGEKKYTVITIGQLITRKRINRLIESIKILKDKNILIRACIVGEGSQKKELLNLAKNLKVDSQIDFVGFKKDVIPYLKESKIYVQSSFGEGLSLSLLEAMAVGLVPITTVAGGEKDIIEENYNGLFVKVNNPNDLAEKIKFLMNESNYKYLKNNVLKTRNQFTMKSAIEKSNEFLKELIIE